LILINDLIINDFRRDIFLSFLKNIYIKYSRNTDLIENLETLMLRDPINVVNLRGYITEAEKNNMGELLIFLKEIRGIFFNICETEYHSLPKIIDEEFKILELVIQGSAINTENNQKIVDFLLNFRREGEEFVKTITVEDYNALLKYFLNQQSYSEEFSTYPLVNIIKNEETRLINYDLVVVFNCNDGFFPVNVSNDPWLNSAMRRKIGLTAKNSETGKSHYDFIQLLSQKKVLITRSIKVDGRITFKSRFLQRLESFLKCKKLAIKVNGEILGATRFDDSIPRNSDLVAKRPEPLFNIKNVAKISATNFNMLMKNPYDFYVKYGLRLKNSNVIEKFNTRAVLGSFFHSIFENITNGNTEPKKAIKEFFYNNDVLRKLYEKKTLLLIQHFTIADKESKAETVKIEAEQEYSYEVEDYPIKLTAKIDRLEFLRDGSVNIIDYKTGDPPSKNDIENGKELQLPFTTFIIKQNAKILNKIDVWSVKGGGVSHTIIDNKGDKENLNEIIDNMGKFLRKVLDNFSKDDSKFKATTLNTNSIYEHLSRVNEWVYE
jgi:ATP-dependent helicase/nuclease subunit B